MIDHFNATISSAVTKIKIIKNQILKMLKCEFVKRSYWNLYSEKYKKPTSSIAFKLNTEIYTAIKFKKINFFNWNNYVDWSVTKTRIFSFFIDVCELSVAILNCVLIVSSYQLDVNLRQTLGCCLQDSNLTYNYK